MVATLSLIGLLGFAVWGHHMFVSGMNPYSGFSFSVLTMSIAVPSAIKTFNWLGTLWGGKIQFRTPMLFALGFVSIFVSGGLSGIFLAQPAVDNMLHATYFVVGHFHLVMGVAAIFGIFSATYYWFPKMFGRMMNETLGQLHFWLTFVGAYCIFMPMHFIGVAGGIRRYADDLQGAGYLAAFDPMHRFMTIAALFTAAAQVVFFYNLFRSLKAGAPAEANPWNATTLEWVTSSPPPAHNFVEPPIVYRGAYDYSLPGAASDFAPQTSKTMEGLTSLRTDEPKA